MKNTKTPEMEAVLDDVTENLFGRKRSDSLSHGICVTCGCDVGVFTDELSIKEYGISGMCQPCQDEVFGKWEGNE